MLQYRIVCINKSPHHRIIVPTLEIVQVRVCIVVIPTISERVDVSNIYATNIGHNGTHTPCIVGISCNYCTGCIGNRNNITLQVLIEIICRAIVFDSANCAVKVVQVLVGIFRATAGIRYKLLDDVRFVKDIVVNFICCLLLNPDTNSLYHTFFILSSKNSAPENGCGGKSCGRLIEPIYKLFFT